MNGAVSAYDPRRGMGFIAPDDGGAEIAFFASEVERAEIARVHVGARLTFDVQTDAARSFAVRLELI